MCNLILCDLDGTLLRHGHPISASVIDTVARLRAAGNIVAIASGRSLYSGRGILPPELRLSYWIFSMGVGILDMEADRIICSNSLSSEKVFGAMKVLNELEEQYMVQAVAPDNHEFVYRHFECRRNEGTDFDRRCDAYLAFCQEMPSDWNPTDASQLIAILPPDQERIDRIVRELDGFRVIRSTSPMDGHSVWLEIFNPQAGKAQGAAWLEKWLLSYQGIRIDKKYAIGNDYNDIDMLRWADHAFITPNSPDDMKCEFAITEADTEYALEEAVEKWGLLG